MREHKCKQCNKVFCLPDKKQWHIDKMPCPFCKTLYCVLPPSESRLRILQDNFYRYNKEEKYMTEIYSILLNYSASLIKKSYKVYIQDKDHLDFTAHDSASRMIMEYYKTRKDGNEFKVAISFAGFLKHKIKESLFERRQQNNGVWKEKIEIKLVGINKNNFNPNIIADAVLKYEKNDWIAQIPKKYDSLKYDVNTDSYKIVLYKQIEAMSLDYTATNNSMDDNKSVNIQIIDPNDQYYEIENRQDSGIISENIFDIMSKMSLDGNNPLTGDNFSKKEKFFNKVAFSILLSKGQMSVDKFFANYNRTGKIAYSLFLEIIKKRLRDLC